MWLGEAICDAAGNFRMFLFIAETSLRIESSSISCGGSLTYEGLARVVLSYVLTDLLPPIVSIEVA